MKYLAKSRASFIGAIDGERVYFDFNLPTKNNRCIESDRLIVSFLNHFETTAPRIERSKKHLLIDIVAAILAVISGADGWGAIEL